MADFLGGALPILSVGAGVLSSQFKGSFTDQVINTGIGVALSPTLGANLTRSLGLSTASGTNPLAGLASQGLGLGQQTINQFVGDAVAKSGIAGPFANLLTNATQLAVGNVGKSIAGFLSPSGGGKSTDKAFPGAGSEPDANYQGSVFSISSGSDVVFSITPATTTAQFDGFAQLAGTGAAAKISPYELTGLNFSANKINAETFNLAGLNAMQLGTPGAFAQLYNLKLTNPAAGNNLYKPVSFSTQESGGWTFITAPQDINWDVSAQVSRVEIFGTNTPPLISGTKGMRNLNLSSSLVEGFSRGKEVEDKIIQLEKLINFSLSDSGFVNVPVYHVTANEKKYGDAEGGYFIIKDIKVKEAMRDLSGKTTRAVVDISFAQVPEYQVDTGVDQASKPQTGAKSALAEVGQSFANKANQGLTTTANRGGSAAPAAAAPGANAGAGTSNRSGAATRNFGATGNPQVIRYQQVP